MKANREELLRGLEEIRATQGDEAYYQARRALALMLVGTEAGKAFLKETFSDLDVEEVSNEAARSKVGSDQDLFKMMQLYVPSMRTQGQFDAYRLAFEALSVMAESYFKGDTVNAEKAREALELTIRAIQESADIANRVEAIPEEERSAQVAEMLSPPKEFREVEEQRRLLAELDALEDMNALNAWYAENRGRMDLVTSQPYRNELFDAIRNKKTSLSN